MTICLRYSEILLARIRETVSPENQSRSAGEGNSETISAKPLKVDEFNEARKERIVLRKSFVDEVTLLQSLVIFSNVCDVEKPKNGGLARGSSGAFSTLYV